MNMERGISGDVAYGEVAPPARSRRRIVVALVLAAIVAAIAGWFFLRGSHKPAPAADTSMQRVTVVVPGRTQVSGSATVPGTLAARHDMPVGVVGEGGLVTSVLVYPGDWVKAGQPLAIVERSVQTQQAAALAASVAATRADAALAQANLDRAKSLVKNGFISKADIDTRTAARDQALARVNVARAQLAEQQARNARLVIRAPAAGLVLTRALEPGQIVGQTGVLFRIAERGQMEMLARVAEQDLARMHIGTRATVTPIGGTTTLPGTIWQLSPIIDPGSRQGVARIALNYSPALRPGGFASASIATGASDVPLLPESAVLSDAKGNYVLLIDGGGIVRRQDVKVGDVGENGVSIVSGLVGEEKVVTNAGAFLSPGEKVIPVLAARAAAAG